ncbi:MAG TPA: glycosyltransferase [Propionibacteriaceae bacterium]|nr:glycosyltransferase [Propionibacteriaceae bacterium]
MRRAIDQLGRRYSAAGHERLLIIPGPQDRVTESADGIVAQVHGLRVTGGYRIILDMRPVLEALERFGPTSVEVSDKWTLAGVGPWARRRGVGSVLFSHERLDDMASDFLRVSVRGLVHLRNRALARDFDRVVVTTDYSAGEWASTGARLATVPLGVDLETFTPAPARSASGHVLRLVHAGRMSREKYPQLAIATAAELDRRGVPVELTVAGTGPHLAWLRGVAEDAPVRFLGYVDGRDELARLYGEADISLSVAPTETFGLAVLEALACGTPVVTADRGGARELVVATCAEWGAPRASDLADAVQRLHARLLSDPEGLRRAARVRAERYRWETSAELMLAVHAEVSASS